MAKKEDTENLNIDELQRLRHITKGKENSSLSDILKMNG